MLWGVVNLLPIYPLDGGQIAREILLKVQPARRHSPVAVGCRSLAAVAMAVFGFVQWHSWFVALFFGYLAYTSYATLQAYSGRSPW